MDRFEAMQKQLFCKLNSIEEKFDGMVQALGFARSVVPEEANHFCGDLIIGGNSQQHMNQPSTGIPIYGRGGNNANCDSYSPAIRHLFGQFIKHNTIVEEEANIRRHEGYEEVCCNDTIITTNTDTTTTIIKSCQPKHYYNPLPPQPYYNNYNNNYSNYNNNRYESSPPYYNFRSYNYKNKRRNGYSPNNRQNKFLGSSSTRSSTPNNFGDNSNSNSIIINPNNDKRGTFGASSRQRKKANTAQTNKEGKGGDAGKEIQEKKGKQVINEKEDVLKKLREWTTRSALLSYTASEDEYDDTTEDDGKTGIKQNESDKVENWRDRSKVVKEKEGGFEVMLALASELIQT
uniref:Uncharacterized protein n=1 Tax=Meloidogyne enterolobii TaxID=390850 RepID=A0A6V7WC19_MELEN|nr:unnamed protein product [Meloidogyne enterolobii]